MFAKTLKTVVLKTVTVTSFKLAAPADRIGQGLRASTANPMDNLSPGQIPMPQYPEPEQVRAPGLSSMQMRQQMQADDLAAPPAGSVGCHKVPGSSAVTRTSPPPVPVTGWRQTTRTAAIGRTNPFRLSADTRRNRFPTDRIRHDRPGSDCQSPGRDSDKPIGLTGASSATAAKK